MKFTFWNLIHWRRHSGWEQNLNVKLWRQASLPLTSKDGSVVAPRFPQPTRLTPQQLEEKRAKGLCYSCDSKYTKGRKCVEKKLFYIYCEEEEENEQEEDIH